jgi:DNA-binding winged helix-turn-helix (wHTH) protein
LAAVRGNEASIQFDLYELDPKNCQLRRCGLPVEASAQVLTILALLSAHPGELVPRKEIKQALWPEELHGDFDSRINFVIKKLREALNDDADCPRYVQTVRNLGYRFIAPVHPTREEDRPVNTTVDAERLSPSRPPITPAGLARFRFGRRAILPAVSVAILASIVGAITSFVLKPSKANPVAHFQSSDSRQAGSIEAQPRPEIFSVSPVQAQARQRIVIRGRGFGWHTPFAHTDSPYLVFRDETAHWSAGRMIPWNWDEVMLDVESWNDTEIVISGFSGDYGAKGWKLAPGDELELGVWNPQSGAGPARYPFSAVPTADNK